jgi:hypothetical protein
MLKFLNSTTFAVIKRFAKAALAGAVAAALSGASNPKTLGIAVATGALMGIEKAIQSNTTTGGN